MFAIGGMGVSLLSATLLLEPAGWLGLLGCAWISASSLSGDATRLLPHRVNRAAQRQVAARRIGCRLRRLPVSLKGSVHYDSAPY